MIPIYLKCPSCGKSWLAAYLQPGAWWAQGSTPDVIAARVYCGSCGQVPPMQLVTGQLDLLEVSA